jgi:ribonuclease G
MASELVINVTAQETRIALIENGTIAELYIERTREKGIVGNIYKGRVVRVLPGMQAAFVDIGLEKAAFLYVADVFDGLDEYESLLDDAKKDDRNGDDHDSAQPDYKALHPIEELLQEGQELLVQVSKEPIGTKGARITAHISLPGRHLVYMPTVEHIGISRRIEEEEERERLREIVERKKQPGSGYIVRTASEGKSEEEITSDIEYLTKIWDEVVRKKDKAGAPSLIHADLDVVPKVVRDIVTDEVKRIVVDSKPDHDRIVQFITTFMPKLKSSVELYDDEEPIFDHYGLEVEISRALGRKVWLKSGGYIIIEQTEALTAIDVNTGRFVGKHNLEDTILKTNLEAVKELAYQLRLRNIGGIIIIDFIDMEDEEHRRQVLRTLEKMLERDHAKTNIIGITELGLVQMTRKRTRESLQQVLCEPCPSCQGRGRLKTAETICYEIFREILREARAYQAESYLVLASQGVIDRLLDEESGNVADLEAFIGRSIRFQVEAKYSQELYDVVPL